MSKTRPPNGAPTGVPVEYATTKLVCSIGLPWLVEAGVIVNAGRSVSGAFIAIGADDDVPFSWCPREHVLYRDGPERHEVQMWWAWFGVVVGFRSAVLP